MMPNLFPLSLFPATNLASSVITCVWIGVFVVAFFNLRFGWTLSGLVVPGYLVPLMISKPWSAAVVLLEGILVYWLVWFYSEYLSRMGKWGNLFGRDRFFALFLMSVAVRIVMDGWLLPVAGVAVNSWLGIGFDYRNNLHSFGLIIVALIANQFWKTGFMRGLPQLLISIAITYLIIRYGLMELTNFSMSGVNYLYEDIASSMLASPKAYIILIVTALLASRMNLYYGWDFNGILIPSLLALQWYQPTKILISFGEALVIYGLGTWILTAPVFQRVTMEGARKLVLFFNVGFFYKVALGYLLMWFVPQYKATDFFAFGYSLSTLIAIKMHDKEIVARLTRATVQTSLVALALASVVGFALTFVPEFWSWPMPSPPANAKALAILPDDSLVDLVRQDKVAMYRNKKQYVEQPLPQELDGFAHGLRRLLDFGRNGDSAVLADAEHLLGRVNYVVARAKGDILYLREKEPRRGWGAYVIRPAARNQLAIEAPAPLDERGTAEAGIAFFNLLEARSLAIGGASRKANPDGSADALRNRQTFFNVFHRELGGIDAVQVRGQSDVSAHPQRSDGSAAPGLWVKSSLPEGFNLKAIRGMLEELPVFFGVSPAAGIQGEDGRGRYADLILGKDDIRRAQARLLWGGHEPALLERDQGISGYLQEWLLGAKGNIADSGSNLYVQPKPNELLFFDVEILTPLMHLIERRRLLKAWSEADAEELRVLDASAAIVGYKLTRYRHQETGHEYLILSEREDTGRSRYWGTYVFRVEQGNGYVVQVPRPIFEVNSFEAGVSLFESLRAEVLLIAGANPRANLDYSADMARMRNIASIFNLVNQVVVREAGARSMLILQTRAFGGREDQVATSGDALLSFDNGAVTMDSLSPMARRLTESIRSFGMEHRFVDGAPDTAGYEANNVPQALYVKQSLNKDFVVLWLSPAARWGYRQQSENRVQQAQFDTVGAFTVRESLSRRLFMAQGAGRGARVPSGMRQALKNYIETQDIVSLHRIRALYPAFRMERLLDRDSQRAFLLVYEREGNRICLCVNLSAQAPEQVMTVASWGDQEGVARFIDSGAAWLESGGDP